MLFSQLILKEAVTAPNKDQIERKLLISKLKSLNTHLAALIQKKIRLDLEIRRTQQKLSKTKSKSSTLIKTKIELEGFQPCFLNQGDRQILSESWGQEVYEELTELDVLCDQANDLLQEVSDLPLFKE